MNACECVIKACSKKALTSTSQCGICMQWKKTPPRVEPDSYLAYSFLLCPLFFLSTLKSRKCSHCKQAFLSVCFCVLMGILTLPFVWSPFSSLAVKIRTSSLTRSSSKPNRRTRQYSSYYRQNHRDPFCRILCHALITHNCYITIPSTALFTTA